MLCIQISILQIHEVLVAVMAVAEVVSTVVVVAADRAQSSVKFVSSTITQV